MNIPLVSISISHQCDIYRVMVVYLKLCFQIVVFMCKIVLEIYLNTIQQFIRIFPF